MSCIILDQNAMDCNPINVQPHLQAGIKRPAPEQTSEKPTQSTRSTTEMNIQALQAELLQLTQGFHFIADQNRHLQSTVRLTQPKFQRVLTGFIDFSLKLNNHSLDHLIEW